MQQSDRQLDTQPRPARSQNEVLFIIFLVFVAIALMFGFFIPNSVRADNLDRLRWEVPPSRVADVLMQKATHGRTADSRCLEARPDVLSSLGVDAKGMFEGKRTTVVDPAYGLQTDLRSPD